MAEKKPTFRNTYWGMAKKEVIDQEDAKLLTESKESNQLFFETKVNNLNTVLGGTDKRPRQMGTKR
jgi:hypothetical protein